MSRRTRLARLALAPVSVALLAAAAWQCRQAVQWRGVVVARRSAPGLDAVTSPEALQAGPWLLLGDPAELDRVASALGLPR